MSVSRRAITHTLNELPNVTMTDIRDRSRSPVRQDFVADGPLDHETTALGLELAESKFVGNRADRGRLPAQVGRALTCGLDSRIDALLYQSQPLPRLLASLSKSNGAILAQRAASGVRGAGIAGNKGKGLSALV